jgi:hypothetical protein
MNFKFGCNKCKAALTGPAEPNAESALICPVCGENDTLENVRVEVHQFLQEEEAKALGSMMRKSRSDALTFTEKPIPERIYRFIALADEN